jgi:iturin family lipopeptide synthetase B
LKANCHIKPDALVALCLDRSEYMLIAILAVLKAGGAYVPMDPSYPSERIEYILDDTSAAIVLINAVHRDKFKEAIIVEEINLSLQPNTNPTTSVNSENLAYVIYTSGTTGNPKGVMIEHKGVVNFSFKNSYINLNENTVTFGYSSYAFDASTFDIFSTLFNAGKLIFAGKDIILNEVKFKDLLAQHKVNTIFITTALFSYYTKLKGNNPLNNVSNILFGGEKLDEPLAKRFSFCLKNYCAKNFWFLRPMLYLKHSGI